MVLREHCLRNLEKTALGKYRVSVLKYLKGWQVEQIPTQIQPNFLGTYYIQDTVIGPVL